MSNISSLDAEIFLGEPYLIWLQSDVFPYIFGAICLTVMLLGSVFNIAYAKLYVKHTTGLVKGLSVILIVNDVIAYVTVLLPSVYFSFGNVDDPVSFLCYAHGIAAFGSFCLQQGALAYGLVVSVFTLTRNTSLEPRKCVTIFWIAFIVLLISLGTGLPIIMGNGYTYAKSEYQCVVNRDRYLVIVHLEFAIFVFLTAFFALVCCAMLLRELVQRRRSSESGLNRTSETIEVADETPSCREMPSSINPGKNPTLPDTDLSAKGSQYLRDEDSALGTEPSSREYDEDIVKSRIQNHQDTAMSRSSILTGINSSAASINDSVQSSVCPILPMESMPSANEARLDDVISRQSIESLPPQFPPHHTSTKRQSPVQPKMSSSSPRRSKPKNKQQLVLSDLVHRSMADKSSGATRQAANFLILWFCVTLCWAPYVVCVYVHLHGDIWWSGWLTVGAICAAFSYCVKPMVILGVKRQLLKSSDVILPQKLTDRASKFQTAVKRVMNNVDKHAFK